MIPAVSLKQQLNNGCEESRKEMMISLVLCAAILPYPPGENGMINIYLEDAPELHAVG
jgi:hypothetical protein